MTEEKLVFVDIETGGRDPKRHPIIQLAAIAVDGQSLRSLEAIEIKVRFEERRANKHSLRKNSFSRQVWRDEALPERDAAELFVEFLRKHATSPALARDGSAYRLAQLVAHNAAFDGPFLNAWFERLEIYLPAKLPAYCTLQRALWHFFERPGASRPPDFKLGTLCKYFGVRQFDAHDALGDVRATVELYRALLLAASSTAHVGRQAA
jgi:DNA polymerase III epsilon subunit-like protein